MGLWGWRGGVIWLHKKALTFKGPMAQQTSVHGIGMHKISSNFRHSLPPLYGSFSKFKEFTAQPI